MTPYLILEEAMIETLLEAVRRGVDVRIITPHIPDKKHIKYMTEYNYGILLKMEFVFTNMSRDSFIPK